MGPPQQPAAKVPDASSAAQHPVGAGAAPPGAAVANPGGDAAQNPAAPVVAARAALEPEVRRLNIALPIWTLAIPIVGFVLCLVVMHGASASAEVASSDGTSATAQSVVAAEPVRPSDPARASNSDLQASPVALHGDSSAALAPAAGATGNQQASTRSASVSGAARKPTGGTQAVSPELAAARENVELIVYYTEWCPTCRALRSYIAERGIRAVEYDVEKDRQAAARYRRLNPRHTIPTIDIDGQVLVGFNPDHIQAAVDRAARAQLARGI